MAHCIDCDRCVHSSQGYYCNYDMQDRGFAYGIGYAIGTKIGGGKADFSRMKKKQPVYWTREEAESKSFCGRFIWPTRCIDCCHCKLGKTLITRKEFYYCDAGVYGSGYHSDMKIPDGSLRSRNSCRSFSN